MRFGWILPHPPAADHIDITAEVDPFRQTEQDHLRADVRQTFAGPQAELQAAINVVAMPTGTDAKPEAAREPSGGDNDELEQVNSRSPIILQLSWYWLWQILASSELQRKTLMNLSFQRGIDLTALTRKQLRQRESLSSICSTLRHLRSRTQLLPQDWLQITPCFIAWTARRI